jgi:hypothetical protein
MISDLDQRVVGLRQEIDHLKAAIQMSTDEAERRVLHMRLNDCIRVSIRLIDERLQVYNAYLREKHRSASASAAGNTLRERSVGGF